jgi:hypothetical protein
MLPLHSRRALPALLAKEGIKSKNFISPRGYYSYLELGTGALKPAIKI